MLRCKISKIGTYKRHLAMAVRCSLIQTPHQSPIYTNVHIKSKWLKSFWNHSSGRNRKKGREKKRKQTKQIKSHEM